jgi:hypothetical protein
MKLKLAAAVLSLSSLAIGAMGMEFNSTSAYVVSVDVKTKSITLKYSIEDGKKWTESAVKWDDKTTWARSDKKIWEETPATVDLAKTLKKDDKVRVSIVTDGNTSRLESLKTIPPDAEVH